MIDICVLETVFIAKLHFLFSFKWYQYWLCWFQNMAIFIAAIMTIFQFWPLWPPMIWPYNGHQYGQCWYCFIEHWRFIKAVKTVSKTHISIKSYGQKKYYTKIMAIFFVFWADFGWNKGFLKAALPIRVQSSSLCFWNQEVKRNGNR